MKKSYFFVFILSVFCCAFLVFVSSTAASLVVWGISELAHEESLFVTVVWHLCQILVFFACFPMFYLGSLNVWLAQYLGFDAVIFLFLAIDCIFWGIIISAIIFFIAALVKKYLRSYRQTIRCDKK